jgi:lysozyme
MRLSAKGAAFIARFEGFVAEPYNDPAGHATIGFGHLIHRGRVTDADRRRWGTISREKATRLLRADAARFERAVERAVTVRLSQPQVDALVSLAFNIGPGALAGSTLVRTLNAGNREAAADQFLRWDRAGSPPRPMAGLTRRRRDERRLFLTGLYAPPAGRSPAAHVAGPSQNFTWLEVHRGRPGFNGSVRARAIVHAAKLDHVRGGVNRLRRQHGLPPTGINVLSWWRPRWYNEQVGGASRSRHINGDGTDIALEEINRLCPWRGGRADFDRLCSRVFADGGFGQYPAGNRHVDSRGFRARWTTF